MKGTTVYLETSVITGYNDFGEPIYDTDFVAVDDVLIGQPSSDDIVSALQLDGKRIQYVLGIPKADTHSDEEWEDKIVMINNHEYHTFGMVETGEQANIPLRWRGNIKVERYGKESDVSIES